MQRKLERTADSQVSMQQGSNDIRSGVKCSISDVVSRAKEVKEVGSSTLC